MTEKALREEARKLGFELRRIGKRKEKKNKVDEKGAPVLDCFHPHLPMRASEYARTKKVYALFHSQIKKYFGRSLKSDSEVYRHYLLLMLEHCARELKINGDGVKVVADLMLPLPKDKWLKKGAAK